MNCKISCSFGEIIDKVTILKIKKEKATRQEQLSNISKELDIIESENPLVKNNDELFIQLSNINKTLWDLEDNIRHKSRKKEFDETYIQYAEQIHIQNDKRYQIKNQINHKYKSFLKEEKIYDKEHNETNNVVNKINIENTEGNTDENIIINNNDIQKLEIYKELYTNGNYNDSFQGIHKLMNKYKNYKTYNSFYIDLVFSYSNICNIFNFKNQYENCIRDIMKQLNTIEITQPQKHFCISQFTTLCLNNKQYLHENMNIQCINYIKGPNISYENMSFFKKNDKNKTILLYDGGGIGDKFMLGRLVFHLINEYITDENGNKIIFIVPENIIWFMKEILKKYKSIEFISDKQLYLINNYDYHCSLLSLIKYLDIDYDKVKNTFIPYKDKINIEIGDKCQTILNNIKPNTYILNWKGNSKNPHEKHNRMMNLINALPLLKNKSVNWLVLSKDINQQEMKILKKYNIAYVGKIIDKDRAFYDTITILNHKNIDGVISTDTSLPHLSLSLDIKTYVLLTTGCEWRWTRDEKTNWYPKAILIRQEKHGDWSRPIQQLLTMLSL